MKKDILDYKIDDTFDEVNIFDAEEQKIRQKRAKNREFIRNHISSGLAKLTRNKNYFGETNQDELKKLKEAISMLAHEMSELLPQSELNNLIEEMFLEITSLGKIDKFYKDDNISEIMVNGPEEVWVEENGVITKTDVQFANDEELVQLAQKIASSVGRSLNNSNPIVDARLPDGSRVHLVISPISMDGTIITIRKFKKERLTIDDLIRFGSINEAGAKFLESLVRAKANIIVSGGTGSGKTTTLNIISNFIPDEERVITIEDSAELQLSNPHVVRLESREANNEGKGEVSIRDLVKASLRMRPDRIVVGEVRDSTAYDLINAMNTGHDGSMSTVHSNGPIEAMTRLQNLVLEAGLNLPAQAIKTNLGQAIDIVIQVKRFGDGSRKITHISEIVEYDSSKDEFVINDIFRFKEQGVDENNKLKRELMYTGNFISKKLEELYNVSKMNPRDYLPITTKK